MKMNRFRMNLHPSLFGFEEGIIGKNSDWDEKGETGFNEGMIGEGSDWDEERGTRKTPLDKKEKNGGTLDNLEVTGDSFLSEINNQENPDAYVLTLMEDNSWGANKVAENFSRLHFNNPDEMLLEVWENLGERDNVAKNHLTDYFVGKLSDETRNNKDCIGKFLNNILKEEYGYSRAIILKNIGKICDKLESKDEKDKNMVKFLVEDGFKQELNPFARKNLADNYDKIVKINDDTDFMDKILDFILEDDYEFMKKTLEEKIKNLSEKQQQEVIKMIESKDPNEKILEIFNKYGDTVINYNDESILDLELGSIEESKKAEVAEEILRGTGKTKRVFLHGLTKMSDGIINVIKGKKAEGVYLGDCREIQPEQINEMSSCVKEIELYGLQDLSIEQAKALGNFKRVRLSNLITQNQLEPSKLEELCKVEELSLEGVTDLNLDQAKCFENGNLRELCLSLGNITDSLAKCLSNIRELILPDVTELSEEQKKIFSEGGVEKVIINNNEEILFKENQENNEDNNRVDETIEAALSEK